MFSGKTTELIHRIESARELGFTTLAIKPTTDTRYASHELVTHTGQRIEASAVLKASEILTLVGELRISQSMKIIAIDEAHFFGEELSQVCATLISEGSRVIVVGLEFDHRGDIFEPFPSLFTLANDTTRLVGVCSICGNKAIHTQRMNPSMQRIVVGGVGDYQPRCEKCFVPSRG